MHQRGSFDLSLCFTWDDVPHNVFQEWNKNRTQPMYSPAMAGGLYAIDREFFYKIGAYDDKMIIWGGENLEMSIRIWCCGGKLVMSPCSRVAHIFRDKTPYTLPGGAEHVVGHNTARLVDVWFEKYKNIFYTFKPSAWKERTDINERLKLRKQLQCKSFRWYIENIFPESPYNIKNYRLMEVREFLDNVFE